MNYTVKALEPEHVNGWLDFFESRAFADNPWWKSCYCTHYHKTKDSTEMQPKLTNREYAKWLIESGRMKGYLAFTQDGIIVGWCNANDRRAYLALDTDTAGGDVKVKSVVCFVIQKEYRKKGIATQLLQRVVSDAKDEGFDYVEAYPSTRAKSDSGNYRGPATLYVKNGFSLEKQGRRTITRLNLKAKP